MIYQDNIKKPKDLFEQWKRLFEEDNWKYGKDYSHPNRRNPCFKQ
jgi:hypothetical protein